MTNTRTAINALWISLIALVGAGMFTLKYEVKKLETELVQINQEIKSDSQSIHVLKAEWSHLNNPSRIRRLTQKHIAMKPLQAEQIINYSDLPFNNDASNQDVKRMIAQNNIYKYAKRNRELKQVVNAKK
jgi:cell division protein FtsL